MTLAYHMIMRGGWMDCVQINSVYHMIMRDGLIDCINTDNVCVSHDHGIWLNGIYIQTTSVYHVIIGHGMC